MFAYGDVVMLKIERFWPWKTVTVLSHLHMPVRPTLLHRKALVSFLLFRKNLGDLRNFFGQIVYRPPLAKNCPYAYVWYYVTLQSSGYHSRASSHLEGRSILNRTDNNSVGQEMNRHTHICKLGKASKHIWYSLFYIFAFIFLVWNGWNLF